MSNTQTPQSSKDPAALPDFPDFAELTLEHKEALEAITNQFASYSDFNFVSLFSWDTEGKIAVSQLNQNLVVKFTDYINNDIFYSFLGTNEIEDTVAKLIEHSAAAGHKAYLSLIPEAVIENLPDKTRESLAISEDRDNHDYILSVSELVTFSTNKFRGKKNLYNRFMKTYGQNAENQELDLSDPEIKSQLMEVLEQWSRARQKTDAETRNEFVAIKRCLQHQGQLDAKGFGTYIDGKLVAFTLFELTKNNEAIIHFDKANTDYVGVFEHLKHSFAKHLSSLDVETINYEQDLGIPGLRQAKESYRPVKFLKKYTVTINSQS